MENFLRHMIVSPDRGGSMARDLENSILPGPVDFLDGKFELVTVGRCLGLLASSDLLSNRTSWKTVSSELCNGLALRVGLVGQIRKESSWIGMINRVSVWLGIWIEPWAHCPTVTGSKN